MKKCSAMTNNDNRCKNSVKDEESYCWKHKNYRKKNVATKFPRKRMAKVVTKYPPKKKKEVCLDKNKRMPLEKLKPHEVPVLTEDWNHYSYGGEELSYDVHYIPNVEEAMENIPETESSQDVYMGYSPRMDTFYIGFDVFGDEGGSHVYAGSHNSSFSLLMRSDELFYGGSNNSSEEVCLHDALHQCVPGLIDLRLD